MLTRLVAGLFILKHMHNRSDKVLCARWIESPITNTSAANEGSATACRSIVDDTLDQQLGEEHLIALI